MRVHVQNGRNLPQAKLDSEINGFFLLNEHGDLYFFCLIIVCISSSLIKKSLKKILSEVKKDIGESVQKKRTLKCKL